MEKPFAQARGFFIYFEIGGEPPEQGIPHATKLPGANLDRQRRVPKGRTPGWGEHYRRSRQHPTNSTYLLTPYLAIMQPVFTAVLGVV